MMVHLVPFETKYLSVEIVPGTAAFSVSQLILSAISGQNAV